MSRLRKQLIHLAIRMRLEGCTVKLIATTLHISPSTVSMWLRQVDFSEDTILEIQKRGKVRRIELLQVVNKKRQIEKAKTQRELEKRAKVEIQLPSNKLLCAFLYWGEGGKTTNRLEFTNSDPAMINTFLALLRKEFSIDEKRLRVTVHVHKYHNLPEIRAFWEKVTDIPTSQFTKDFIKESKGSRVKKDYMGCIRVSYGDWRVVYELKCLYNAYARGCSSVG